MSAASPMNHQPPTGSIRRPSVLTKTTTPMNGSAAAAAGGAAAANGASSSAAGGSDVWMPPSPPVPCPAYDTALQTAYKDGMTAVTAGKEEGWTFQSTEDGVDIYFRPNGGSALPCTKGVGVISGAPAEVIAYVFSDFSLRPSWDQQFSHSAPIETIDSFTSVHYLAFKSPALLMTSRDYCVVLRTTYLPGGRMFVVTTSVEHERAPRNDSYVRGQFQYTALLVEPISAAEAAAAAAASPAAATATATTPNSKSPTAATATAASAVGPACRVVYCVASNPNGSVPSFVASTGNLKPQALCVAAVRQLFIAYPRLVPNVINKLTELHARVDVEHALILRSNPSAALASATAAAPAPVTPTALPAATAAAPETQFLTPTQRKAPLATVSEVAPAAPVAVSSLSDADAIAAATADALSAPPPARTGRLSLSGLSSGQASKPPVPVGSATPPSPSRGLAAPPPVAGVMSAKLANAVSPDLFASIDSPPPAALPAATAPSSAAAANAASNSNGPQSIAVTLGITIAPDFPAFVACAKYDAALRQCYDDAWTAIAITPNTTAAAATTSPNSSGWIVQNSKTDDVEIATRSVTVPTPNGFNTQSESNSASTANGASSGTATVALTCSRGIGYIRAPPFAVGFVFQDFSLRPRWEDGFVKATEIERIDPLTAIYQLTYRAPAILVKARDYVVLMRTHYVHLGAARRSAPGTGPYGSVAPGSGIGPCMFVHWSSVEHPKAPPRKDFIRAHIQYAAVLIEPDLSASAATAATATGAAAVSANPAAVTAVVTGATATASRVTYVWAGHQFGSLPQFMINSGALKHALCVSGVRTLFATHPKLLPNIAHLLPDRIKKLKSELRALRTAAQPNAASAAAALSPNTAATSVAVITPSTPVSPAPNGSAPLPSFVSEQLPVLQRPLSLFPAPIDASDDAAGDDPNAKDDDKPPTPRTAVVVGSAEDSDTIVVMAAPSILATATTRGRFANGAEPGKPKRSIDVDDASDVLTPLPSSLAAAAAGKSSSVAAPKFADDPLNGSSLLLPASSGGLSGAGGGMSRSPSGTSLDIAGSGGEFVPPTPLPCKYDHWLAKSASEGMRMVLGGISSAAAESGANAASASASASPSPTSDGSAAISDDGWTFVVRQNDVDLYTRMGSDGYLSCRGVGVIRASPEVVAYCYHDPSLRARWDDTFLSATEIESVDVCTTITHASFRLPWPFSPRDYVLLTRTQYLPRGHIFVHTNSIEHTKCPPNPKYVRGNIACGALYLEPLKPTTPASAAASSAAPAGGYRKRSNSSAGTAQWCKVTYCLNAYPNGTVPDWAANNGIRDQPLCISRMRDLLNAQPKLIGVAVSRIQTMKLHMLTDSAVFEQQVLLKKRQKEIERKNNSTGTGAAPNAGDSKHATPPPKAGAPAVKTGDSDSDDDSASGDEQLLKPATDAQLNRLFGALPASSKYDQLLDECFVEAEAALRSDGWSYDGKSSGVDCYVKSLSERPGHAVGSSSASVVCCKGIGVIAAPADVVVWTFGSVQKLRPQWDEMFSHGTQIESVDVATNIVYYAYRAPWPVTPRDFCVITRQKRITANDADASAGGVGSILVAGTSTKHPRAPPVSSYVRASLRYSALLVQPIDSRSCRVTWAVCFNYNGSVPRFLIEQSSKQQALCVHGVRYLLTVKSTALVSQIQLKLSELVHDAAIQRRAMRRRAKSGAGGNETPRGGNKSDSKDFVRTPRGGGSGAFGKGSGLSGGLGAAAAAAVDDVPLVPTAPLPPNKYDSVLEAAYDQCMRALNAGGSGDGWTFHSRASEVDIYTKPTTSSGTYFTKGVGIIEGSAEAVRECAFDRRHVWDDTLETHSLIQVIDSQTAITYSSHRAPWPVTPRDFCLITRTRILNGTPSDTLNSRSWSTTGNANGTAAPTAAAATTTTDSGRSLLIMSASVTHESVPVVPGYVRAHVLYAMLHIKPLPVDTSPDAPPAASVRRCQVTYIVATDPITRLPQFMLSGVAVKQPLAIATMRAVIKKSAIAARARAAVDDSDATDFDLTPIEESKEDIDHRVIIDWKPDRYDERVRSFLAASSLRHAIRACSTLWQRGRSLFDPTIPPPKSTLPGGSSALLVGYLSVRVVECKGPAYARYTPDRARLTCRLRVGGERHFTKPARAVRSAPPPAASSGTAIVAAAPNSVAISSSHGAWNEDFSFAVYDPTQPLVVTVMVADGASDARTAAGAATAGPRHRRQVTPSAPATSGAAFMASANAAAAASAAAALSVSGGAGSGAGRAIGRVEVPLVELTAPPKEGSSGHGGGRRGWFLLEQRESSMNKGWLCLETNYVSSRVADMAADFLRPVSEGVTANANTRAVTAVTTPAIVGISLPRGSGVGSSLRLPVRGRFDDVASANRSRASSDVDSDTSAAAAAAAAASVAAVDESGGDMKLPTAPAGASSSRADSLFRRTSDSGRDSTRYDAEILVRNAYRLMDAAQPAARALLGAIQLLKWTKPTFTILMLVFTILCCVNPWIVPYIIPLISLWFLFANWIAVYSNKLGSDSLLAQEALSDRADQARFFIQSLQSHENDMSAPVRAFLRRTQNSIGSYAATLEEINGLFCWDDPSVTWAIAVFNCFCLYAAAALPVQSILLLLTGSLFAWYLTPFAALRFILSRAILHTRRKRDERLFVTRGMAQQ